MSLSIKGLTFVMLVFIVFKVSEAFMVYEQGVQLHENKMEFIKKVEERLLKMEGNTE